MKPMRVDAGASAIIGEIVNRLAFDDEASLRGPVHRSAKMQRVDLPQPGPITATNSPDSISRLTLVEPRPALIILDRSCEDFRLENAHLESYAR